MSVVLYTVSAAAYSTPISLWVTDNGTVSLNSMKGAEIVKTSALGLDLVAKVEIIMVSP